MRTSRRSFLGVTALGAAACAAPRAAPVAVTAAATTGRWEALRAEFALNPDRIHLAGMLFTSYPRVVREAIDRHRQRLDVDPVEVLEHDLSTGEQTNATLDAAARYLGAKRDEIALTDSTTSGLALVYGGLTFAPGDEIVTTAHDHWVTHESLRLAAERSGARVRPVTLYQEGRDATEDAMTSALAAAIGPATRVVAVTWVHSSTGVKTPIRRFADAVAQANASRPAAQKVLLCVDGVHGFGVEAASMGDLGCDVFVAGCHKWIFGPHGTGIVWARPEAWDRIRPVAMPFHFPYVLAREYGIGSVPKADGPTRTPGGFRAYEHRWALREAFELHLGLGKSDVEARIHELASRCKKGLAALPNVSLHTPMDPARSSGILTFEVAGLKPADVVARLKAKGIVASDTPYRPSYARFSPGLTNTPEEIDRAVEAVRGLA
jgi:selenocysteine lyase/cysteine desulfurase